MNEYLGLVSSCARTMERNSSSELYYLLTEILCCENVDVTPVTGIPGLTVTSFQEDPIKVLGQIEDEIEKDNAVLRHTLKIVPFQYRVKSSIENYKEVAKVFKDQINTDETWKITLRRRHSQLEREDIISAIALEITEGKVMLENPQHYILVEVLGKWTYLALSPLQDLSLSKYYEDITEDDFTF